MDLELRGKVAVVTGASKGIGLAVTKALADEGVRVVAGARSTGGDLSRLAEGGLVHPVSVDLSTPDGPRTLVARTDEFGGLDILVNNVGVVSLRLGGFASVTDEEWLASLNVNLMAAIRTTRAALPSMLEARQRQHRHHQLGECLPSRSRDRRLLRRESRADEFLEGPVERGRPEGHPDEHRESGTCGNGAVARPGRRRSNRRKGDGR